MVWGCRVDMLMLLGNVPFSQFQFADIVQKMASSYVYFFGCPWLPERILSLADFGLFNSMFSKGEHALQRRCVAPHSFVTHL